jgi:uncharacterized protein YjbI with pentapeptide repeats
MKPGGESKDMFTISPCAAGCGRSAISGSNICFVHQANQEQEIKRIENYIAGEKTIKDLNAAGIRFTEVDFSGRRFFGCNFKEASFSKCIFSDTVMRMCFFFFFYFFECDFFAMDLQFLFFFGA